MTTVAYRDGVMAADRAISTNALVGTARKVWRRKQDGALLGMSGSWAVVQKWSEWFLAGERGPAPPLGPNEDSSAHALLVRPEGAVEWHYSSGKATFEAPYYAIGSGSDFAMGAMAVGASARQAVAAAARHDPHTGGGVQFVKLS